MGHQLWTSPITGYRRKGTRLSELRSLTEAGITAHAILEPLKSCPAEASAAEAAEMLRRRDFDVAGVKESPDEHAIGWVAADELKDGLVRDHMQDLTAVRKRCQEPFRRVEKGGKKVSGTFSREAHIQPT